jgi:hypothetical protein
MRQTHLTHVYVEWDNLDRKKDERKRDNSTAEERELAGLRLEATCKEGPKPCSREIFRRLWLEDAGSGEQWSTSNIFKK